MSKNVSILKKYGANAIFATYKLVDRAPTTFNNSRIELKMINFNNNNLNVYKQIIENTVNFY